MYKLIIHVSKRFLFYILCLSQVTVHRHQAILRDLEKDKVQLSSKINDLILRYLSRHLCFHFCCIYVKTYLCVLSVPLASGPPALARPLEQRARPGWSVLHRLRLSWNT